MPVGVINFPTTLDTISTLIQADNSASTTLSSTLNSGDTTANVADTSLFSSSGLLVIDNECITYTGKTATTFTGLVRGFEGTTAATHSIGAAVESLITARHHNVLVDAILSLETAINSSLITLSWGSPSAEASNKIEVLATLKDYVGLALATDTVEVEIKVTDGAADAEPSATATISSANIPIGTLLSGTGTATAVFRTDSNGQFKVGITETSAANRYLWVKAGGHQRYYVRSSVGILQLVFS